MCGIAGVVARNHGKVERALRAMVACQLHRGPDDEGLEIVGLDADGGALGLGQRRLAIQDLSPAGRQPMAHPRTGDLLIYNGELYNGDELRRNLAAAGETFRGHSDTEIILYLLAREGPACLPRLRGMFALAYFNARHRTLLLARDPMGIKPLYTAHGADGSLLFASEVRAVLASGLVDGAIDPAAVAGVLAYGAVPEPLTFFASVRAFPPGSHRTYALEGGAARPGPTVRWWRFPAMRPADEADAVTAVRAEVEASVKGHLVSDVPVGVFLSSGLDSTIVAAMAARHSPNIRSFTVGFADQPDLAETTLAGQTARDLGTRHTEIQITGADAERSTVRWLSSLDQPSVDGLNTYVISKAVREQGIVVALSGLGGDELFGGYPSFTDVPRFNRWARRLAWMPAPWRVRLLALAAVGKSESVRQKTAAMADAGTDLLRLCLLRRRVSSDRLLTELGLDARGLGLDPMFVPPEAMTDEGVDDADPIATVSRLESRFYMRNMLLRDSDTNGMAHSLEIRVPLLDTRLMDLAYAIPGPVRRPAGKPGKHLLRRAFADFLRPDLLNQPKMGFTLPIRRWMAGPMRGLCEESLRHVKQLGLLRPEGVDAIWRRFIESPESQVWSAAFTLCVLGQYAQGAAKAQRPTRDEPEAITAAPR